MKTRSVFLKWSGVCLTLAILSTAATARAQACTIDNIPSMLVQNSYVVLNKYFPTTIAAELTWASFKVTRSVHTGVSLHFAENKIRLEKVLVPAVFAKPYEWVFSDGTVIHGWTATHAFKHTGTMRVSVKVFLPNVRQYYVVDSANVMVR